MPSWCQMAPAEVRVFNLPKSISMGASRHWGATMVLLALGLLACTQLAAAERPDVGTVCCPDTKTYLASPRNTTALMTFPGSGNTWVRHIVETLTGYHTSSVYCDKFLQPVFKAECDDSYMWDKSIAVKTHMFSCWWKKAIVIIRHPLRAIMGDYQRLRTGRSHTGVVDPKNWNWDDWYALSTRQCLKWTAQFQRIFGNAEQEGCGNTTEFKVFFYEDLKTSSGSLNPYFLDELLSWFGIPKEDSFYECALMNNKGHFARKLPSDHPATRILNDTETFRRMSDAGCLQAYDFYSKKFPHLKQPDEKATPFPTSSTTTTSSSSSSSVPSSVTSTPSAPTIASSSSSSSPGIYTAALSTQPPQQHLPTMQAPVQQLSTAAPYQPTSSSSYGTSSTYSSSTQPQQYQQFDSSSQMASAAAAAAMDTSYGLSAGLSEDDAMAMAAGLPIMNGAGLPTVMGAAGMPVPPS